jgi:hypothetical protein
MTSLQCPACADLNVDESEYWEPFDSAEDEMRTVEALQASSLGCHSGGCNILLKAISKVFPDAPSTAEFWSRFAPNGSAILGAYNCKERDIELFVSEGISPV